MQYDVLQRFLNKYLSLNQLVNRYTNFWREMQNTHAYIIYYAVKNDNNVFC